MKFQRKLSAAMATVLMGSGLAAMSTPASAAVDSFPRECDILGFVSGNGSETNPFQIWNGSDLQMIEGSGCVDEDAYFVQMADIDLSNYADWDPIGANGSDYYGEYDSEFFDGQYDGNGFEITNLEISIDAYENQENYGLFGSLGDASISNLTVDGSVAVESYYEEVDYDTCFESFSVGGVAGIAVNSAMYNVHSAVDVSGGESVGGVVGSIGNEGGNSLLQDVSSSGRVTGDGYCGTDEVGGIAGSSYGTVFEGVTSTAYVTTDSENKAFDLGGLIGYAVEVDVNNSSFAGEVYVGDASGVGGLIGYADDAEIDNSFNSGKVHVAGDYSDGVGGLVGDYDSSCQDPTAGISESFNSGEVFAPMAYAVGGLTGHWISSDCDSSYEISSYTVSSTSSGEVTGEFEVGGLFGWGTPRFVTDSSSSADVNHIGWDEWAAGGIAGYATEYSIFNGVSYTGDLVSGADSTGGLVGYAEGYNVIYSSFFNGTIEVGHEECIECWDIDDIGGLVGYADNDIQISRSYAAGTINAFSDELVIDVGGLVGQLGYSNSIVSSYSTVDITAHYGVGGLVGAIDDSGNIIRNTYVLGDVTGIEAVAGLIGYLDQTLLVTANYVANTVTAEGYYDPFINIDTDWTDYTETNFFWDESGELSSYSGATGVTAAELKDPQTFFESGLSIRETGVWASGKAWATCSNINEGLPYLTWQVSEDPCPCVAVALPTVQFKADSANLSYETRQALRKAAKAIAAAKCTTVNLTGFTSTVKATKFAKKLATDRVNNVKNFLLDQLWDLDHAVKFTTSIQNVNTKNPADRKVTSVALKMKR